MPRCEIVVLVPHPERPDLLTRADDLASLPTTVVDGEFQLPAALAAIGDLLGSVPPVLRVGYARTDSTGEATLVVVDLETIGPEAPVGLAWTDRLALPVEALEPVELRTILPRWIQRRVNGPTPDDPAWAHPGWFARVTAWAVQRLAAAGMPAAGPWEVAYTWGISMVLRAPTASGDVYLKATPRVFPHEAAITACLAAATPGSVTRVIAVEPTEGWLLMRDHGSHVIGDEPPEAWAPGLQVYARLQREWSGRTDALVRAGAEVRTLDGLAAILPTLASTEPLLSELREAERAEWDAALPALTAACLAPGRDRPAGDDPAR